MPPPPSRVAPPSLRDHDLNKSEFTLPEDASSGV